MRIEKTMTLAELVRRHPELIETMNELKLDYCCGGTATLEQAAEEKRLDAASLAMVLEKCIARAGKRQVSEQTEADPERFAALSLPDQTAELVATHHRRERELMAELRPLINKILSVHYGHHSGQLIAVHRIFSLLAMELEAHFVKEEALLFPLMCANSSPTAEQIEQVRILEAEHDAAGALIKQLQAVTEDFTPPEDACGTYALTFERLKALTEDIFMHIFKENAILLPKYYGDR